MDRCVILVDVGYLLAEGGKAYAGATRRSQVRCDYAAAAASLEHLAQTRSTLPLLRSYWYDGAPDYVPTQDHHIIGALPRVKLRLGRLVAHRRGQVEQKGVDSLIVHDLITLAQERAVSTVFLLAGDEDLREGVAAAQRLGVQIVLLGIPTSKPNQSDPLVREADEVIVVGDDVLRAHFDRAGVEPASPEQEPSTEEGNGREAVAVEAAKTFARDWAGAADPSELAELLTHAPQIPKQLDVQLLLNSEEAAGFSLRGRQTLRHALRQAFWDQLSGVAGITPSSSAPHDG